MERPRILCVEGEGRDTAAELARDVAGWEVIPQADLAAGLHRLRHEPFAGVFIDTRSDALHHAGRALSDLEPDQLADMCVEERVELLKHNIRQFIHELLHYDVIEIRLLNKLTGRLDPLLADGMTPDAARRVLYAEAEGNGVTGLVAATGKSYLCPDTAHDPHYIEGAAGARSSLTVLLMVGDEVIGTFNVESPRLNAFTVQDLQ